MKKQAKIQKFVSYFGKKLRDTLANPLPPPCDIQWHPQECHVLFEWPHFANDKKDTDTKLLSWFNNIYKYLNYLKHY